MNLKAILFLVLMVGATVGAIYLYRTEHPESTPEDEQDLLPPDLDIFGSVYWGSRDMLAIIAKSGEVYELLFVDLSYEVTGRELKWDTLSVIVNITVVITIGNIPGSQTVLYETYTEREGDIDNVYNVTDIILDMFTKTQISNFEENAIVNLEVFVILFATVQDIYGIERSKQALKVFADTGTWVSPEVGINASLDSESDPYLVGYDIGYDAGWDAGYFDHKFGFDKQYSEYSDHQGETYDEGYADGFQDGYVDGWKAYQPTGDTPGCFLGLEDIKIQEVPLFTVLLVFVPFVVIFIAYIYFRRGRRR